MHWTAIKAQGKRLGVSLNTITLSGALFLLPWIKLELFPRIIWADALFLLWGLMLYMQWTSRQRPLWRPSWPLRAYGLLLVLWVMALLASGLNVPHPGAYTFETIGLIYLAGLSWLLAYVLSTSYSSFETAIKAVVLGLAVALAFGLLGILDALLFERFALVFYNNKNKLIATFKYPNQLAGFLVLFLPLIWERFLHAPRMRTRLLYGGLSLLMLIEIAASGSRAGMVAALFGLGLSSTNVVLRLSLRRMVLIGVITAGIGSAIVYLQSSIRVIHRAFSGFQVVAHGEITDPFRLENWRVALQIFYLYPLTGYGVANVAPDFGYEIHNTYLAVAAETGFLGLLTFLGLLGFTLFIAWQNTRWARKAGRWSDVALGLWIGLLAEWLYATQHHMLRTRHLWVVFALVVALNVLLRQQFKQG